MADTTGRRAEQLAASAHEATGPPILLEQAKLRPPAVRDGMVLRTALVDRLCAAPGVPVISIVAPAGYGKSALVQQWAARTNRTVAWLSLEEEDNDPTVLSRYLAAAVGRIGSIDSSVRHTQAMPGTSVATIVARRVAATLASLEAPVAVVLDNTDVLHNPRCRDAVGELSLHLPLNAQLVAVARSSPVVPVATLRAHGAVLEVDAIDLAMDEAEAEALLAGAERHPGAELADLVARTEGWPVGLYLAALAHLAGGDYVATVPFTGDDRLMADYLRSELLDRMPRGRLQFLMRTSVLDRMSGPLCDAVLDTTRSARLLEALEESNLLLTPLDRRREWYRYHPLFRDLLRSELDRREGHLVAGLHARAARWCQENGLADMAIEQARAAGDADLVATLVADNMLAAYAAGRMETVRRWVDWFEERDLIDRYPAVAILGAALSALMGQPGAAERCAAVAERAPLDSVMADGSPYASWCAVVRAMMCRRGVGEMVEDARLAYEGLAPTSLWRATARALQGVAQLLQGDADLADATFAHAEALAVDAGAFPVASVAVAERAIAAIERGDWAEADALSARAVTIVRDGQLGDYMPSALVYAVAARTAAHRGDMGQAQLWLAHATRLRPQLSYATPFLAVQALVELTCTYLSLADASGARMVLREAADVLRLRPDLGVLGDRVAWLRTTLDSFDAGAVGASSLTKAELRLVPLLSTHLSFPEIGERLHISRHTVKTQAVSLYRKLGVSSRSEAIACLDKIGLLGT